MINRWIFIGILVVAAVLCFYNYFNIPFTHDEFSALFRTQFDSFSELIEKGVAETDTHPPLIQVFLYYWIKLFGASEWIVKLPFTVCGLGAVVLVYLIAKKWYNETVGLFSAAFFSSIQYTIVYSQVARPYISGLFFALAMVYFWTQLMLNPEKRFYKNSFFYILFTVLCAYNHHFSLLFAAIVGMTGVFIIPKKYIVKYLISAVIILLLYIPNIPIVLAQLKMGGIEEWLAKPHNDFMIDYILYIFQYSVAALFVMAGLTVYGLIKRGTVNYKFFVISILWFLLPFLIGFFYSRYVNAVLQYSCLIFSFPFLLFFLLGHIKLQKPAINLIIVVIILTTNIFALVKERQHYTLFYRSPYQKIVENHEEAHKKIEKTVSIIDSHRKITQYYLNKTDAAAPFIWFDSFSNEKEWASFVKEQAEKTDYLYLGCISSNLPTTVPVIQEYFPSIIAQNNYSGGTTYLFSKEKNNDLTVIHKQENPCFIDSLTEYAFSFSKPLLDIISNPYNFIDVSVKVLVPEKYEDILLVSSLETEKGLIYWSGTPFDNFIPTDDIGKWTTIHHSLKLSDIYLRYKGIEIKVYIWNKGRQNFLVKDFSIDLRKGNPLIYSCLN